MRGSASLWEAPPSRSRGLPPQGPPPPPPVLPFPPSSVLSCPAPGSNRGPSPTRSGGAARPRPLGDANEAPEAPPLPRPRACAAPPRRPDSVSVSASVTAARRPSVCPPHPGRLCGAGAQAAAAPGEGGLGRPLPASSPPGASHLPSAGRGLDSGFRERASWMELWTQSAYPCLPGP